MTSEEKAKKLVDKYKPLVEFNDISDAKQCATICVDEIIEQFSNFKRLQDIFYVEEIGKSYIDIIDFWESTKQHIQQQ